MSVLTVGAEPTRWQMAGELITRNPLFVGGLAVFAAVVLCALFAPWIAPYEPNVINFSDKLVPPSLGHPFGTDDLGRDIFSRVVYGSRTSLIVGITVLAIALIIGMPIGLLAGYYGGRLDTVLMRIADVFLAFPPLLLPIAITAALGAGLFNAMLALAVAWFPWYARILRGAVLRVRNEHYIAAAKAMGVRDFWIMIRHALPNSTTPVFVQASMDFGYTILAAASLSFIGIGARPPTIEWGLMIALARTKFLDFWWIATFPGLAIFGTVLAVNLVGDGLRDLLDPRYRGRA